MVQLRKRVERITGLDVEVRPRLSSAEELQVSKEFL